MPKVRSSEPHWSLLAARMVGACALGVLAQAIVDMPGGYFGEADRTTTLGAGYALGVTLVGATVVIALLLRRRWALALALLVLSLNVGIFLPVLGSDPLVAGIVVLWNLTLLAAQFLPAAGSAPRCAASCRAPPTSSPFPAGRRSAT